MQNGLDLEDVPILTHPPDFDMIYEKHRPEDLNFIPPKIRWKITNTTAKNWTACTA